MKGNNQFPFAVKVHHSQHTETRNFESFESADEFAQQFADDGIRVEAYEIRDGKTLDMYTGEDIQQRYDDWISELPG